MRLKSQQETECITEELRKVTLNVSDDERTKSINSIKWYAYGINKDIIHKNEETKYNNIINIFLRNIRT